MLSVDSAVTLCKNMEKFNLSTFHKNFILAHFGLHLVQKFQKKEIITQNNVSQL